MPAYIFVMEGESFNQTSMPHDDIDYYEEEAYFDRNFTLFDEIDRYIGVEFAAYRKMPYEVIFVISILGVVFNILNIVVYSRPSMVSSINILLLAFEAANIVFFSTFIAQGIELYNSHNSVFTYGWFIYKKLNPYIRLTSSFVSNWLAVTIGIWRCIAVGLTLKAGQFLTKTRAKLAISFLIVVSPLLSLPSILLTWCKPEVIPYYNDDGELEKNYTLYTILRIEDYYDTFFAFNIITLFVNLFPCLILIVATLFLLFSLRRSSRARKRLTENVETQTQIRDRKMTIMLSVILGTFVLSYLPDAGCTCLLIHHYEQFLTGAATWAGDGFCKTMIMGGLYPLISNTITLFIYYSMSENFRETFQNIFMSNCLFNVGARKKSAASQITVAGDILDARI